MTRLLDRVAEVATEPGARARYRAVTGRVTSFDVAEAAGVSQSTVSRALRGEPSIGTETVARIVAAAAALDYVPSDRARDLSRGTTKRIAMVVDLENPLWSLLVGRLHDLLADLSYHLTLIAGHPDSEVLDPALLGGGIDGVILSTVALDSTLPAILQRRSVPTVLLQRYTEGGELDSSVADDRAGGAASAQILLDAGHQRIGALLGPRNTSTGRDREAGFRECLADAGIELDEALVRVGSFDFSHGYESVSGLFSGETESPTALFCSNDSIAFGALNRACELGIAVPGDLAIVGFDDLEQASWATLSLSTVHVPFDDMLHSAVTMLMERIAGRTGLGRRVIHPVYPVLRSTHGD